MKKQIRKLLHRFENLKFRKKLSVLMLIVGLVPVVFLAFSMQYGMTNQLREKEQYNLEKILEQSVNSIENQSQIYENLVDYLSYSQSLRIFSKRRMHCFIHQFSFHFSCFACTRLTLRCI